jgi:hypothetical protein
MSQNPNDINPLDVDFNDRKYRGKKVLVRSSLREVTARTYVDYDIKGDEEIEVAYYRQFHEYECYMTPMEAFMLVYSDENKAHIDQGVQPPYHWPAGSPYFIDENDGGPLSAPLAETALASTDVRSADRARSQTKRREQILAGKRAALVAAGPAETK